MQWKGQKSFQILIKEIDRQTYPDGGNKEQAFAYLGFVLDFFLLAALVREANGHSFRRVTGNTSVGCSASWHQSWMLAETYRRLEMKMRAM